MVFTMITPTRFNININDCYFKSGFLLTVIYKNMKKELKKIAIDEDTSLSGLILKMIEEAMENRDNN